MQLYPDSYLIDVDMLIDQALIDICSGNPEQEEWGLGELVEIATAPDTKGTYVSHRAASEFNRLMNQPLVKGVTLNGQPITRENLALVPLSHHSKNPEIFEDPSGQRTCASPWRCYKKQFTGSRRKK